MKKIILIGIMLLGANEETYGQLSRKPVNAKYIGQDLCIIDSTAYTWYKYGKPLSGTWIYEAIYFDRKKVKSYSVMNIAETNNIYYTYDAKKQEKLFAGKERESAERERDNKMLLLYVKSIRECEKKLLYVGNISELERVYIDTNDNKQYVKTLIPIKDEYTRFLDGSLPVKGKFYPVIDEIHDIIFTNKNYPGRIFYRITAPYYKVTERHMLLKVATDEELSNWAPHLDWNILSH